MKPARLLRWYPRAWREQYGEELLALIQDTVDEGRPAWRVRLGVIWGGLRERAHQATHPSKARAALISRRTDLVSGWLIIVVIGLVFAYLPLQFSISPPTARAWQVTAALYALAAVAAFMCAVVLAGGLTALPSVIRFLRAGGWPKIRRRVACAAGATGPAVGGLVVLSLTARSEPYVAYNISLVYFLGLNATALAVTITIGLWASAVTATARYLELTPRVRAAELVVGPVASSAVLVAVAVSNFWLSAVQASVLWLLAGIGLLVLASIQAPVRIRRAVRRGRRLRAAASGRR